MPARITTTQITMIRVVELPSSSIGSIRVLSVVDSASEDSSSG